MKLYVKRNDKLEGYGDVPVTIEVTVFDGERDEQDSFEKTVLAGKTAEFEFEVEPGWGLDVECHVNHWEIKEWIGLEVGEERTLGFGLRKNHLSFVEDYHEELRRKAEKKRHAAEQKEAAAQVAKREHPSQIVNDRMVTWAILIGLFVLAPAGVGGFIAHDERIYLLRNICILLFAVGLAGFGYLLTKSGVNDARCKKCNSNLIRLNKTDEKFRGTYSRQEKIMDRSTGKTEWRQVIKSDFDVTEHYSCDLCKNKWTNSYTQTTDSN